MRAGYAHCNVTAASISWLESSQSWFISDLAHAAALRSELPLDTACLNVRAAAPEMVAAAAEGAASVTVSAAWDVWQLGLLAYELVLGAPLFDAEVPVHFVQMMLTDQSPLPWEVSEVWLPAALHCGATGQPAPTCMHGSRCFQCALGVARRA